MTAAPVDRTVNGALVALGVLAVVDNVVFHWLLAFHRFKTGWPGSVYVEVAGVADGVVMVVAGVRREWTARRAAASPPQ